MKDPTPDLAYLLLTQRDVAAHPNIAPGLSDAITEEMYVTAGLYASRTGCAPTYRNPRNLPALVHWSDLEDVLRHARNTVTDSMTEGWLPADATAPF